MAVTTWLRRRFALPSRFPWREFLSRRSRRSAALREWHPSLECLEDRLAPSITLSISDPAPFTQPDSGTTDMIFVVTRSARLAGHHRTLDSRSPFTGRKRRPPVAEAAGSGDPRRAHGLAPEGGTHHEDQMAATEFPLLAPR
jgi:hypothetical protein